MSANVFAQLSKGKKLFFKEQYRKALPVFETLIKENPNNAEAYYYGGICHLQNYDNLKGLQYLQKAIAINPNVDKKHQFYWLGVAYHYNYELDSAYKYFSTYKTTLSKNDQRHSTIDNWLNEIAGSRKTGNMALRFWVEQLGGNINTTHSEHSPLISQDGKTLYYTSRDHQVTGGKRAKDGGYYEDIYQVSIREDGSWGTPEKINNLLNTKRHDASCQLFDNDRQLLLYRWKNDGDLFIAKRNADNTWSEAVSLPKKIINTRFYESHGFVTADGKALYFASNRGNIRGDLDLYVSYKNQKEEWQEAKKLSAYVNSPYDDDAPFVTADGKELYFSSRGHNTIGGFDIFRCVWDEKRGMWGPAQNVGEPLNTAEDDIYAVWNTQGTEGFFASNRVSGKGEKDIYRFGKVFDITLEGGIYSKETQKPLSNISLDFINQGFDSIYSLSTQEDGKYSITIGSDISFNLDFSYALNSKSAIKSFYKDTFSVPLAKRPAVVIKKDFYIPEPKKLIQLIGSIKNLYNLNPMNGKLVIRDTESDRVIKETQTVAGKFDLTLPINPDRLIALDLIQGDITFKKIESFTVRDETQIKRSIKIGTQGEKTDEQPVDTELITKEMAHSTPKKDTVLGEKKEDDLIVKKNTAVITQKESIAKGDETVEKQPNIVADNSTVLENIYFGYNKDQLGDQSKQHLDKIAATLKRLPQKKITLTGHTDFKGSESYNIQLSKRRVKAVYNYLLQKGVSKDQLAVAHFGERVPTVPNKENGTDQTINQQLNRRVEIIDQSYAAYTKSRKTLLVLTLKDASGTNAVDGKIAIKQAQTNALLVQGASAKGIYQVPLATKGGEIYHIMLIGENQSNRKVGTFIAPHHGGVVYRKLVLDAFDTPSTDKSPANPTDQGLSEHIFYDFNHYEIRPDAAVALNKWVAYLKANPSVRIELISHSDSKGNKAYNIALSKQRMKAAASYLNKKGIDATRIHKKLWFDEGQLTNKCREGVDFPEKNQEFNRRTEIRILEK
ncbi:MAG: OmpA family protein [Flammeovirgaceae bacterium]